MAETFEIIQLSLRIGCLLCIVHTSKSFGFSLGKVDIEVDVGDGGSGRVDMGHSIIKVVGCVHSPLSAKQ